MIRLPNSAVEHTKKWHDKYKESSHFWPAADGFRSERHWYWRFIIVQTIIVILWMGLNVIALVHHWDVYPFILLNLLFSTQAAYAASIIMMAQNRQSQRDRVRADSDYKTNVAAKKGIEELMTRLDNMKIEKLDKIIALLEKMDKARKK